MKRSIVLLLALSLMLSISASSQDRHSLKAADLSFDKAEKNFKRDNFKEAAQSFEITVNNIPEGIESRKYVDMRLESIIKLIDIYFYKVVNLDKACENLELYTSTLQRAQSQGVLKGKDLLNYLNMEQDYAEKRKSCENRETLDSRKKEFEKILEAETKE